jgi:hypothetical protein
MVEKVCSKCKLSLPEENFWKQKDKLRAACKTCCYKTHRSWVEANRESHLSKLQVYNKKYYLENSKEIKSSVKQYQKENSSKISQKKKVKYAESKLEHNLKSAKYYKENKTKVKSKVKAYQKNNKAKVKVWSGERKSAVKKATPRWLTEEHWLQMNYLYWLASDLSSINGEQYDVDHIVPLRGKTVCGLHVPWNLQVLPSDLNRQKSNKHET